MLIDALFVCTRYLRIKVRGEWPAVDRNFKCFEENGILGLSGSSWASLLSASYRLAEEPLEWDSTDLLDSLTYLHKLPVMQIKIRCVLWQFMKIHRQFSMDGLKNVWVVKAPEACRGLGIKVLHRLDQILELEKGMGGRTVQKYVENPLLAPFLSAAPSQPVMFKFDLRVWVLVTSFLPLQAYIYSATYGRRCGAPYSTAVTSLTNDLAHLTNYSIQKTFALDHVPKEGVMRPGSSRASLRKPPHGPTASSSALRGSLEASGGGTPGAAPVSSKPPALTVQNPREIYTGGQGGRSPGLVHRLRGKLRRAKSVRTARASSQVLAGYVDGGLRLCKDDLLLGQSDVIAVIDDR